VVEVSDRKYPVTATLSVAVKVDTVTVKEEAVAGRVKAVIIGMVVSNVGEGADPPPVSTLNQSKD
jgi:hypothetical protein